MFIAIVPAHNEEKTIGSVVQSLFEHVDRVVVVDDASSDATSREAEHAQAIVLRHEINLGQGAALETGHTYARGMNADYVLHFDADEQFDAADIDPALEKLQAQGADILFGSRFFDKRSNMPWFKRHVLAPLGRIVNLLFGAVQVTDAHNGFRILNKKALDKIRITQNRMAHATEILALTKKYNLNYIEFPVQVTYHEYGQRAVGGFKIVRDLLWGKIVK